MTSGGNDVAFITGITGQDGSYLTEFLLGKGYEVHGLVRPSSINTLDRIQHLVDCEQVTLHYGDITDSACLVRIIEAVRPDEVYNLAAQPNIKISSEVAEYTTQVNAVGTLRLLEAIRITKRQDKTRFFQASTSELFGSCGLSPLPVVDEKDSNGAASTISLQNESTSFAPRSPYAISKLHAHWMVDYYRQAYGLYGCCGILFNHESPRRGPNFVTRKITRAVSRIHHGLQSDFELGNLNAKRDWGDSRQYVKVMWAILQGKDQGMPPTDYVVATGKTTSVRQFVDMSFEYVNRKLIWEGEKSQEKGVEVLKGGRKVIRVRVNPDLYRPTEVDVMVGDSSKVRKLLNLGHSGFRGLENFSSNSAESPVQQLVHDMMDTDLALIESRLRCA